MGRLKSHPCLGIIIMSALTGVLGNNNNQAAAAAAVSSFSDGISPTELIPNYSANCDCSVIEIVSTRADVLTKHGKLLGRYRRREENVNSRPSYEHFSSKGELKKNIFWPGSAHFQLSGVIKF